MTSLKDSVKGDTVGIRWLRTAGATITSVAGALAIIWAVVTYIAAPHIDSWATGLVEKAVSDFSTQIEKFSETLAQTQKNVTRLESSVETLGETVALMKAERARDATPSWRFSPPDTQMSDGEIGGEIQIKAGGYKLRDCGVPVVDLYFINGGGVYHRFQDVSLLSEDNRGIALPVDPARLQTLTYSAVIPADDGVHAGRALGFISITYPVRCPYLEPATVGPLQFRIRNGSE